MATLQSADQTAPVITLGTRVTHMQYTEFEHLLKIQDIQLKSFAQNIDSGYMLEMPRQYSSNKYTQSMFWSKIRKYLVLFNMSRIMRKLDFCLCENKGAHQRL